MNQQVNFIACISCKRNKPVAVSIRPAYSECLDTRTLETRFICETCLEEIRGLRETKAERAARRQRRKRARLDFRLACQDAWQATKRWVLARD